MLHSTKNSGQSLIWLVCVVALAALGGCGDLGAEAQETDEFRAALVSEQDLTLSYDDGGNTRSSALNGEISGIAALTAETVVSTNAFLGGHLRMMRRIVSLPPSESDDNMRVWEGTHDGLFLRVRVDRGDAPRGTRFDYQMSARPADDASHAMLAIFDGHVVRVETRPDHDNQGWGVARYHFDNINTLAPEERIDGKARVAFRRVGNVRQVRVRLIEIKTPEDPNFPKAAAYDYVLLPDRSGRMKWYARADFNGDGAEPLEKLAVHSYWRSDRSGAGAAIAAEGTLEVDYVASAQCWDTGAHKTYEYVTWPDSHSEEGQRSDCAQDPDQLDPPEYQDQIEDADPAIPSEHPEEQ